MKLFQNQTFDENRPLTGEKDIKISECTFNGDEALLESENVMIKKSRFSGKAPLWHVKELVMEDTNVGENCGDALWYGSSMTVSGSEFSGNRLLRNCSDVNINDCAIDSDEFGWSANGLKMRRSNAKGTYLLSRAYDLDFKDVNIRGKYPAQYIENGVFSEGSICGEEALWYAKNITIRDSILEGRRLAWYSEGLILINCVIMGSQPMCRCKNLRLINCELHDADLCFEKSEITAEIKTNVLSIKNPYKGMIIVPSVGEIIMDDEAAKGVVCLL